MVEMEIKMSNNIAKSLIETLYEEARFNGVYEENCDRFVLGYLKGYIETLAITVPGTTDYMEKTIEFLRAQHTERS
jgi:hypothetical protein